MSGETNVAGAESLAGAMERASKMPDSHEEFVGQGLWDEGNVWFGDWGKWEDSSNDK